MTDEAAPSQPGDKQTTPSFSQRLQTMWRGLVGVTAASDPTLRESLEEALEGRDEEGRGLTLEERHMLVNILSFGELRVDDVMVPRADVFIACRTIRACRSIAKHSTIRRAWSISRT